MLGGSRRARSLRARAIVARAAIRRAFQSTQWTDPPRDDHRGLTPALYAALCVWSWREAHSILGVAGNPESRPRRSVHAHRAQLPEPRRNLHRGIALWIVALLAAFLAGCSREAASSAQPVGTRGAAVSPSPLPASAPIVEVVYDGGTGEGLRTQGGRRASWARGRRASISRLRGLDHRPPGLSGRFGALGAPGLRAAELRGLPRGPRRLRRAERVPAHRSCARRARRALADGWSEIVLPLQALDPDDELPFDRVVLRAATRVGAERVLVRIGFTAVTPGSARPPPPTEDVALSIVCRGAVQPVSPLIYEIPMIQGSTRKTATSTRSGPRRVGGEATRPRATTGSTARRGTRRATGY